MVKKQKTTTSPIEKTLTSVGIALVIFGAIASLYYTYVSRSFLDNSLFMIFYYINYLILLVGGFAIGYFLTRKASRADKLFTGTTYALITYFVFLLIDILRLFARPLLSTAPGALSAIGFPGTIEGALFTYSPLVAVVVTLIIAAVFQLRSKKPGLSLASRWTLIVSFLIAELYAAEQIAYYTIIAPSGESSPYPVILTIAGYLLNPLVITLIAFLFLSPVKSKLQRLFYAVFIAAFSAIFMQLIWNFRIDPTVEATNIFQIVSSALIVVITGLIIWKTRRDALQK